MARNQDIKTENTNIQRADRWFYKKSVLISGGIFGLALLVRFGYLYESSSNPTFRIPIVDSFAYDTLARDFASGKGMGSGFFWQPFFYPFFLSWIYRLSGSSILCAKIIQALLGSLTCLLTFYLGKKILDLRTGLLAGLITAVYGPLFFFETELIAAGWAAFWSVLLVLLFLNAASKQTFLSCFLLGVCGALSTITRPTFGLFFFAGCLWLAIIFFKRSTQPSIPTKGLFYILAGFLLIAVPVALKSFSVTGRFSILPSSGGINLYIGNNPDYAQTVTIRPGSDWKQIVNLPGQYGITSDAQAEEAFFKQRFADFVLNQPVEFIKLLGYKTIQFINSREIPRNVDIYVFRKWSYLLRLLTWQVHGFGFPFGVLLPMALLGLVCQRSRLPVPVYLFLLLYSLSIILVFVSARYCVPIIPILSILAATGVNTLIRLIRMHLWRPLAVTGICGLGIVLLMSLPGPFPEEKVNYEGELYYGVGCSLLEWDRIDEAINLYSKALNVNSNHAESHGCLAEVLMLRGHVEEAILHNEKAVALKPTYAIAHNNLAVGYYQQGEIEKALKHWKEALRLRPDWTQLHAKIDKIIRQKELEVSIAEYIEMLRLNPENPSAHYDLGTLFFRQGRIKDAIRHWTNAVRLKPDWPEALNNLAWVLATGEKEELRDPAEAVRLAKRACELTNHNQPKMLDTLAAAYASAGRFADAVETAEKAKELAVASGQKTLAADIEKHMELYKRGCPYRKSE